MIAPANTISRFQRGNTPPVKLKENMSHAEWGKLVTNLSLLRAHYLRGMVGHVSNSTSRVALQNRLGKSFDDDRDIYTAMGYSKSPTFEDFNARYIRQDIAKRIVNAYPDATWRGKPKVWETVGDDVTEFEEAWTALLKQTRVFHYLRRLDRLVGVGKYGVMYLGLDDSKAGRPATNVGEGKATKLLFLQVYSQGRAEIVSRETSVVSARYGMPKEYALIMDTDTDQQGSAASTIVSDTAKAESQKVHWERVLHVADNCLESDVYGVPRLECVNNRLEDLERVVAGAAEGMWRGGFPGLNFALDPEISLTATQITDLEDEVEDYMHGFKRYLRTQGLDIQQLTPQVTSPKEHVDVLLQLIASAVGIPTRILSGSERGELASQEDEKQWINRVDERRLDFAEPCILRAFINRLIWLGVLPEPEQYTIEWPDLRTLDEKEMTTVMEGRTRAVVNFGRYPEARAVMSHYHFLTEVMQLSPEKANMIIEQAMDVKEARELSLAGGATNGSVAAAETAGQHNVEGVVKPTGRRGVAGG